MSEPNNTRLDKIKYNLTKFLINYQRPIELAADVARSFHNFAISKSPLSFIEGGVRVFMGFSHSLNAYSYQFFNSKNGWDTLIGSSDKPTLHILEPVLKTFPFKHIQFKQEELPDVGIYYTPVGQIGFNRNALYYQPSDNHTKAQILEFLIQQKIATINSNFFSISAEIPVGNGYDYPELRFDLNGEKLESIASDTAEQCLTYVKSFIDKNIHRSILFIGPPGTGKTVLSQTIIDRLGFRTLKFKYDPKHFTLNVIKFLITSIGIEAIILDDFDQIAETNKLLEFLSWIHDNTKLVILITNSLKPFHPAILRPGRIDKVIEIDCLDETVVKSVFDDTYPDLVDKVKHWPIAFINELYFRIKANPQINFGSEIKELELRVKKQHDALKA